MLAPLILVIEDEPRMQHFLRISLAASGYRLVLSQTGEDGVSQAALRNPDVVLLDLGLPDIDGLEVARHIRSWSKTPIIVLSARGRERDKVDGLDAGADDYLTKPFGVNELLGPDPCRAEARRGIPARRVANRSFPLVSYASIWPSGKSSRKDSKFTSRRSPTSSSCCSYETLAKSSRTVNFCGRFGVRTPPTPTTSECSWHNCDKSWNPIHRTRATSSRNPAWAIVYAPNERATPRVALPLS